MYFHNTATLQKVHFRNVHKKDTGSLSCINLGHNTGVESSLHRRLVISSQVLVRLKSLWEIWYKLELMNAIYLITAEKQMRNTVISITAIHNINPFDLIQQ